MLKIQDISKSFGKNTQVLKHIDYTVKKGKMSFLLGSSGCGKSTLLRTIAGLVSPDEGHIILDGQDITKLRPEARNTPMVFQNYALWPHLNVFDNVAFGLKIRKLPKTEIERIVTEMLSVTEMLPFSKRKVNELSGGQQQRVALARALALNGKILLLDEPLSNLDAKLRDQMRLEIRKIRRERNLTALYVTHDRREALSIGDEIAIMENGVILEHGTPYQLYHNPRKKFTATFLGDANLLQATCIGVDHASAKFSSEIGELVVNLNSNICCKPQKGMKYTLMFRPETIKIDVDINTENSFSCVLQDSVFLGEVTNHILMAGNFKIHADETSSPVRPVGTTYLCGIGSNHLTILENE